ncbi:MAG: ribonuclease P protein component [Caulobacteraceae bacterium]
MEPRSREGAAFDVEAPTPHPLASGPTVARLKNRAQFLAVAKGASLARGAVAVQKLDRRDDRTLMGAGFTATKKIGGAVVRNRAKRRLREAARALLPLHGTPGCDYVFVARAGTVDRDWLRLLDDMRSALIGLAAGGDEPRPARKPRSSSGRPAPRPRQIPGSDASNG